MATYRQTAPTLVPNMEIKLVFTSVQFLECRIADRQFQFFDQIFYIGTLNPHSPEDFPNRFKIVVIWLLVTSLLLGFGFQKLFFYQKSIPIAFAPRQLLCLFWLNLAGIILHKHRARYLFFGIVC